MKSNSKRLFTSIIIVILLLVVNIQLKAQTQIFGICGWQANSDVTVAQGELKFDDAMSYGAGIDIPVERYMQAEISWSMSSSNAYLEQYLGTTVPLTDVDIHHFQVGSLIEPERNKKVSPFGLLTLGASLFHATERAYEDEWRFSVTLGGGVKVYLSDKVGLRFQGRLIIPMQFSGGSIYVGSGGTGVAVGAWTAFVEGDFSGGLFIRL